MKNQKKILKKKLQKLYKQREAIDNEIAQLEKEILKQTTFSKNEKIDIFRSLFISRDDIFLKKWISKDLKKENFYPATASFQGKDYTPLSNEDIEQHLRGNIQLATYTISKNNTSSFLVLQILPADKIKIINTCLKQEIEGYFEINSKGDLYLWFFFDTQIKAKEVKQLGQKLVKESNISAKIFPNHEFVNSSSLGDFVALPLHLKYRNEKRTVFIKNSGEIIPDQWMHLNSVKKISYEKLKKIIKYEKQEDTFNEKVLNQIDFPSFKLKMFIYDFLYIPTKDLSSSLLVNLKSLATFDNPQIKTLLALRKPIYNTPRVIRGYEEDEEYLKLPRGLSYDVQELFIDNKIDYEIIDKKFLKQESFPNVVFNLRDEQQEAIQKISKQDFSICVAPPGFGKTLIGAKMVELRGANTLVVVNKNMLLDQWIERFVDYFKMNKKDIGFLGKSKNTLNKKLDIATMQSLKNRPELIKDYSFVIVDECHHIPAVTFEQIIKNFTGKYILGLSATPNRKDGLEPILYQQLGKVSYEYKKKRTLTHKLKLVDTNFSSTADNFSTLINELCEDENRNQLLLNEIKNVRERKTLILTDRIEHINILERLLENENINYLSIHGSLSKKDQKTNMEKVQSSNLILATTSYFGEGIDFPHLNTIIFATPISYHGRLIQYLGRVGRDGQECLAIDLLDSKNAMLYSAYKKRLEGYKQMHYSARY